MAKRKAVTPIEMFNKRYQSINSYVYNGVEIWVEIDFKDKKISLINEPEYTTNKIESKKWIFANRGLEYMAGWKNILDAMKYAINQASLELANYNENK